MRSLSTSYPPVYPVNHHLFFHPFTHPSIYPSSIHHQSIITHSSFHRASIYFNRHLSSYHLIFLLIHPFIYLKCIVYPLPSIHPFIYPSNILLSFILPSIHPSIFLPSILSSTNSQSVHHHSFIYPLYILQSSIHYHPSIFLPPILPLIIHPFNPPIYLLISWLRKVIQPSAELNQSIFHQSCFFLV